MNERGTSIRKNSKSKIFIASAMLAMLLFTSIGLAYETSVRTETRTEASAGDDRGRGVSASSETRTEAEVQADAEREREREERDRGVIALDGRGREIVAFEMRERIRIANSEVQMRSEGGVNTLISGRHRVRMRLELSDDAEASAELRERLRVKLSNGRNAEVKIMPDTASETAIERLRLRVCTEENDCQIELREVRHEGEVRAAYEVRAKQRARMLGIFNTQMDVRAEVDAETGEVIRTRRPWWAFLATTTRTEASAEAEVGAETEA